MSYDWKMMLRYRPDLGSPEENRRKESADPLRAAVAAALKEWREERMLAEFAPAFSPVRIHQLSARVAEKVEQCERLIGELERVIPTDETLGITYRRRPVATAELLCAELLLARHRLDQVQTAVEATARSPHPTSGVRCVLEPYGGSPVAGPTADRDREAGQ